MLASALSQNLTHSKVPWNLTPSPDPSKHLPMFPAHQSNQNGLFHPQTSHAESQFCSFAHVLTFPRMYSLVICLWLKCVCVFISYPLLFSRLRGPCLIPPPILQGYFNSSLIQGASADPFSSHWPFISKLQIHVYLVKIIILKWFIQFFILVVVVVLCFQRDACWVEPDMPASQAVASWIYELGEKF